MGAPFYEPPRVPGGPFMFSSGAAYVYVKAANGTWMQTQTLIAPDMTSGDNFGRAGTSNWLSGCMALACIHQHSLFLLPLLCLLTPYSLALLCCSVH